MRQINVDECVDAAVDVGLLLHIIIWNWFNCRKVFCWFYCEDPKDTVFSEFCFLVFMTCFQVLLALIILEISSIVCLHLRLWFLSLLFVETIILIFSNSFLCLFLLFKFNRTKNCFSVACIPNFQTFFKYVIFITFVVGVVSYSSNDRSRNISISLSSIISFIFVKFVVLLVIPLKILIT